MTRHPSVDLGAAPVLESRIENLKDLLASIDENGELYPGEAEKVRARLARLTKLPGRVAP